MLHLLSLIIRKFDSPIYEPDGQSVRLEVNGARFGHSRILRVNGRTPVT